MRRLVFVTQVIDPEDELLGVVPAYLAALEREVDELVVIANEVRAVPEALGGKVISLGKERGYGRLHRTLRYEAALARVLSQRGHTALLAHMCPVYLNLAVPIAVATGARTMLWYAHPALTPRLRLAERLADAILTTSPGSYPGSHRKAHYIGQGIDTAPFVYSPTRTNGSKLRVLAPGRIAPEKGVTTVVKAAAIARARGMEIDVRVVGPSKRPEEQRHRVVVEDLIDALDVRSVVSIEPPVKYRDMPALLSDATVVVSASDHGCADKTAFEAAAIGRPVLAASRAMEPLLGGLPLTLTFPPDDAAALVDRLQDVANASNDTLEAIGKELRHRVQRDHSNFHWAAEVVGVAEELWSRPVARERQT